MWQRAFLVFLSSFAVATSPVSSQEVTTTADGVDEEFAKEIRYGALEIGVLAKGDARLQAGEYRDLYSFEGDKGDPVLIELLSDDFDPYLAVVSPSGLVKRNDDWGSSSASRIQMNLPEAGSYRVVVTSFRPGEEGAYVLRIRDQRVKIAQ